MVTPSTLATVHLWGRLVGAVSWDPKRDVAAFEFNPAFLDEGLIDLAPITMPAESSEGVVYAFSALNPTTFRKLPGVLADALPDKFGEALIDTWLAQQGRPAGSMNPVERLCYTGNRGMGALEFKPVMAADDMNVSMQVDIDALVNLAGQAIARYQNLETRLDGAQDANALQDILRVGTSAGGARAKAIVAMDDKGEVRSGQVAAPPGFTHYLLKFDGVTDLELGRPQEFTRIEYAYYLMAQAAGIHIMPSRLLEEGGRAHFITERFDRQQGRKIAMQSLCGMAHFDFNQAGAYGYEQAFAVMRKLGLPKEDAVELYRRMLFNVLARNQDDHTKNISFVMDNQGPDAYAWRLSPAYDVTYAYNPAGSWTSSHQMTIAGKRDGFTREALIAVGRSISLRNPAEIIEQVAAAVRGWEAYAERAGLSDAMTGTIKRAHRTV